MSILRKLYEISPIYVQNIAITFYGYWIKYNRYGEEFSQYFTYLQTTDKETNEFLLKHQNQELKELINYASIHIPYYQERLTSNPCPDNIEDCSEILQTLPIVTKELIKSRLNDFTSSEFKQHKLQRTITSGTTGTPFTIFSTSQAIQRNYAFFARFLSWHEVSIDDQHATFAGRVIIPDSQSGPPYWRYNKARNQMLFSSYHISKTTIPFYIRALERLNPKFIDAFPSPIFVISQFINKHKIRHNIRPKVIVTSSEVLTDHFRKSIENAFHCPVADQYGAAEMAGFIGQCEHGKYHVAMEFGRTEVLTTNGSQAQPGETGQLICTGFLNKAMPFIRYQTGDSVVVARSPCSCGRESLTFDKILGRTDDLIITREGRLVSGMGIIFHDIKPILEAQIIQEDLDHININIVSDRKLTSEEEHELLADLQNRIGNVKFIHLNYFDQLKRTKGGKLQTVISYVPHDLLGDN